nr:myb-binding protein 1A-like protein [Cherax quadricarinatus]
MAAGKVYSAMTRRIPRHVLTAFERLVVEDVLRQSQSSIIILKHVEAKLNSQEIELADDIKYIIRRLVGGLRSNRLRAREGFYTTLQALLQLQPSTVMLTFEAVIEKYINEAVSKHDAKDRIMGEILAYGALIRSGQANTTSEMQSHIISRLFQIRKIRTYMDVMASQFLVILMEKCEGGVMYKDIWKHLENEISKPVEQLSPCSLWLRLALLRTHTHEPPQWLTSTLQPKNYISIGQVIMKTMTDLPKVHPLLEEVVKSLSSSAHTTESPLIQFWLKVLEPCLAYSPAARIKLLFNFLQLLLSKLKRGCEVAAVMTSNVVTLLVTTVSRHDNDLSLAARGLGSALLQLVTANTDESSKGLVIPQHFRFDPLTGTKLLAQMKIHYTFNTIKGFAEILNKIMKKEIDNVKPMDETCAAFALSNLVMHSKVVGGEHQAWRTQQLIALMKVALFTSNPANCEEFRGAFFKSSDMESQVRCIEDITSVRGKTPWSHKWLSGSVGFEKLPNLAQFICCYRLMCPEMTHTTLTILTDVLDPANTKHLINKDTDWCDDLNPEQGDMHSKDEQSNESEEEIDEENNPESEMKSDSGEDDEEDDESEDESGDTLNIHGLRQKMVAVAGDIDVDVDMDSVPQEELDNLDRQLGAVMAAFQSKQKAKKKGGLQKLPKDEKNLMHFQSKVCGLLEIFLKESPAMGLLLGIINPLCIALYNADKDTRKQDLQNKLRRLMFLVGKIKKCDSLGDATIDVLMNTLDNFFTNGLALSDSSIDVVLECYLMLYRCGCQLLQEESHKPDNPLITIFYNHLEHCFTKSTGSMKCYAFHEPCCYNLGGLWSIVALMTKFAFDPEVRVFRRIDAMQVLHKLYKNRSLVAQVNISDTVTIERELSNKIIYMLSFLKKSPQSMSGHYMTALYTLLVVIHKNHSLRNSEENFDWETIKSLVSDIRQLISKKILHSFRGPYNSLQQALKLPKLVW